MDKSLLPKQHTLDSQLLLDPTTFSDIATYLHEARQLSFQGKKNRYWRRELQIAETHFECLGQFDTLYELAVKVHAARIVRPTEQYVIAALDQLDTDNHKFRYLGQYVDFRDWVYENNTNGNPALLKILDA